MANDNIITQLSIFVNNEPGRLAAVARILKDCGVNMKACNLAESTEFGILRAIVDEPDKAFEKIKAKGIIVKKTDIIGVAIHNVPGSLFEAADVLGHANINIEYGYAYASKEREGLFIRVDEPEKAIEALSKAGIKLIKGSEI
ncbi:MAG: amino acid-binding protein [Candidatus Methanomethylophilaceae archaeon]|nr:amino acid-binding protein [Candidatus Methanomethylophilaceae archaeon]MDD3379163.1 amino acid-binding protein [Candidatus Methanomethylophilaceae archaeon]